MKVEEQLLKVVELVKKEGLPCDDLFIEGYGWVRQDGIVTAAGLQFEKDQEKLI